MPKFRSKSSAEQVTDHLREQLRTGAWKEWMPGEAKLAAELSVGRIVVTAAIKQLEKEGLLQTEGRGKRRRILRPADGFRPAKLRIVILLYEKSDRDDIDNAVLLSRLQESGFHAEFSTKSLKELGMNIGRVSRYVKSHPADAWILSSASRDIIEWFSRQATPAIAMYGRSRGLPIAAAFPIMIPTMLLAVRRLIALGHKRIVMITREERRKPKPSRPEQSYLDELEAAGLTTSTYNLPEWTETRDGFIAMLDGLFRYSPPTAILFQESSLFIAARSYLSDHGIVAPRNISLILVGRDPSLRWHKPEVSHIYFDYHRVVRCVVRWTDNVARGKEDRRQTGIKTTFVDGGTIGPAPESPRAHASSKPLNKLNNFGVK